MWRDLWAFVRALRKHFFGLAGGTFVGAVMLLWDDVLHWGEIPSWAWVVAAVLGLFISGFNAWREEHGKVAASPEAIDPEASRRPEFERQIAKLNPDQQTVLRYVINVGDTSAQQLRDRFFHEQQNKSVSAHDADLLMLGIAETTGLLEPKDKGTAFPRYGVKAVWANLLTEWTAPPTVVDKRIADKARALRRTLAASFEDWPAGLDKLDDLTTWAAKLLGGFPATERMLTEIVERRPDASRRVERTVGTASDAYYAAADIINRLFKKGGLSIDEHNREAVGTQIREAVVHVKECLAALDTLFT
ncbi:MAG TPA: hypothetical protein VN964_06650 [Gemmatimonadales bacterium]|nr:hypothetical protein [Gemmatimonadales bacterium]